MKLILSLPGVFGFVSISFVGTHNKALTLSLVIPAYNEERYLKACLEAVAQQTISPIEVIVVDNNSTDKTADIAQSYNFVRLVSEKKQGRGHARNKGFDLAIGDNIGRVEFDTVLSPDSFYP